LVQVMAYLQEGALEELPPKPLANPPPPTNPVSPTASKAQQAGGSSGRVARWVTLTLDRLSRVRTRG
jgi:hypothetical protein